MNLVAVLQQINQGNEEKKEKLKNLKEKKRRSKEAGEPSTNEDKLLPVLTLADFRFIIPRLPRRLSEDILKEYFDRYGDIVDVYVDENDDNGRSGRLTFSHLHKARPDGKHFIEGERIMIERYTPVRTSPPTTIVIVGYVSNLSKLREYLVTFGNIIDFRHQINSRTHRLSSFVFVQFNDPHSVKMLIDSGPEHFIESDKIYIISFE